MKEWKSDKPFFVIPIDDWAFMASHDINSSLREAGFKDIKLSEGFFKDLVNNVIDDVIDEKSLWCDNPRNVDDYLDGFEWFNPNDNFSSQLYSSIDIVVTKKIKSIIDHYIPENTWYVWYIKHVTPSGLYVIERGEDYRITEYYRLKERYEPEYRDDNIINVNECLVSDINECLETDIFKNVEDYKISKYDISALKLMADWHYGDVCELEKSNKQ